MAYEALGAATAHFLRLAMRTIINDSLWRTTRQPHIAGIMTL